MIIAEKILPATGKTAIVYLLTFGRARLAVCEDVYFVSASY